MRHREKAIKYLEREWKGRKLPGRYRRIDQAKVDTSQIREDGSMARDALVVQIGNVDSSLYQMQSRRLQARSLRGRPPRSARDDGMFPVPPSATMRRKKPYNAVGMIGMSVGLTGDVLDRGYTPGSCSVRWANGHSSMETFRPYPVMVGKERCPGIVSIIPVIRDNGLVGLHPEEALEEEAFSRAEKEDPVDCTCVQPSPEVVGVGSISMAICKKCLRMADPVR